jgi:hypothetical protein
VSSEDAARIKELAAALSGETTALAKLKASCAGLQKKAAEVQVRCVGAASRAGAGGHAFRDPLQGARPMPVMWKAFHPPPCSAAPPQAKIDNAGGEPLRRAKERVAKLTAKIAESEAGAAKMRAQSKAAAKQLEKLRKDAVKQGGWGGWLGTWPGGAGWGG